MSEVYLGMVHGVGEWPQQQRLCSQPHFLFRHSSLDLTHQQRNQRMGSPCNTGHRYVLAIQRDGSKGVGARL